MGTAGGGTAGWGDGLLRTNLMDQVLSLAAGA
jgi:hypothetical protein